MPEKSRGESQVVSSNFVTLYPLEEGEERFGPVLKSVAQAIDPQMKRKEIHQLLRQKIEEYGPETDNGKFVDKVRRRPQDTNVQSGHGHSWEYLRQF